MNGSALPVAWTDDDQPIGPEIRLFRYIILHAVLDAIYGEAWSTRDNEKIRGEALRWFGQAGSDFQLICECAGWDAPTVRRKAIDYIQAQRQAPQEGKRPPIGARAASARKAA